MIKIHGIGPPTAEYAARPRNAPKQADVADVAADGRPARGLVVDAGAVVAQRQRQREQMSPPAYMLASLIESMGGAQTSASKGSFIRLSV